MTNVDDYLHVANQLASRGEGNVVFNSVFILVCTSFHPPFLSHGKAHGVTAFAIQHHSYLNTEHGDVCIACAINLVETTPQ